MSRLAEVGRDARVAAYLAGRDGVEAEEQRAVWCRLQQEWQRREAWRRRAGVAVRFSWTTLRQELSRLGPAGSQWKSEVVEDEVRAGWAALWWRVVRRRSTWRGPFWGAFVRSGCRRRVWRMAAAVLCHHAVNCLVDAANKARRA